MEPKGPDDGEERSAHTNLGEKLVHALLHLLEDALPHGDQSTEQGPAFQVAKTMGTEVCLPFATIIQIIYYSLIDPASGR